MGAADLAALYGDLGSREVETVAISDEESIAGLLAAGLPQGAAELITSFGRAIREGALSALSTAVQDLTGRPPVSLRSVLEPALAASS